MSTARLDWAVVAWGAIAVIALAIGSAYVGGVRAHAAVEIAKLNCPKGSDR